jgi:GT2 family glycosyltransferase
MNVSIILLDYHRHDFTEQVKHRNFNNAGHPFDYVRIDMKGIATALNAGIKQSLHYDAIVTMANDILMPDNWLKAMVLAASLITNTGMCGIHCVEGLGNTETINGVTVHPNYTAFGNVLIPMSAINKVGPFNEDYDPYGMQDADYAHRLNNTGHINYYLQGMKSEHIGHDVGQPSDYRRMKDEGLNLAGDKWAKWNKYYEENGYTINQTEWPV